MTGMGRARWAGPLAAAALAVVAVPAGGQVQPAGRALESAAPEAPDPERAPLPGSGIPTSPAAPPPGGSAFVLSDVRIEGATLFGDETLAPLWADLVGVEISPVEAGRIAQAVEAFFRDEGYVFTRVLPTAVDPASGRVTLRVIEARITSVTLEEPDGDIGPVRALVERLARPLEGLENPRLADLERVLLLLNDIPGIVRATAVPRRGEGGPGAVALVINAERDALGGALFADDRQTPAFGPGVIGALGEWRSWSSGADTTRLTFTNSFGDALGQEFWTDLGLRRIFQVEHERHLGADGTRVGGRALHSASAPEEELARLDLEGEETEFEVWVEHPVLRTRPASVWLRAGFSARDSRLSTPGRTVTNDSLRRASLGARALTRDATGYVLANVEISQGLDVFDASEPDDADLSRSDGDPQATILSGGLEREQLLVGAFSLFVRAEGQWASDPLPAGEEFELGGVTFGRGYDPSEVLGDHGYGTALELRRTDAVEVGPYGIETVAYGFLDYGRVLNIGIGVPDADELVSVGFGLRARPTPNSLVGVELAKPMEALRRDGERDPRLFLSAQIQF
ncbi:MAG: ShlB/FhaC/HecB family hemolysin secretion/activation protein [Paracoccaceae bacterium]